MVNNIYKKKKQQQQQNQKSTNSKWPLFKCANTKLWESKACRCFQVKPNNNSKDSKRVEVSDFCMH